MRLVSMLTREGTLACGAALLSVSAIGQEMLPSETAPGSQIQRLQRPQVDAAKALNPRPIILSPTDERSPSVGIASLPIDSPCFAIERIVLDDSTFEWLARLVQPVVGQCVGKTALKHIQDAANNALIERGFLTSRVLVPSQSLQSGTLTLAVVPGRLAEVKPKGPAIGWLRTALPTSSGKLLNQRDIDQALENLRRLRSQSDATFDIAPGAMPGRSDLVLHPGSDKRWHGVLGVDNAGLHSTGKTGLSGSLTYDSPLHLYDQLQIAGATNANFGAPGEGTQTIKPGDIAESVGRESAYRDAFTKGTWGAAGGAATIALASPIAVIPGAPIFGANGALGSSALASPVGTSAISATVNAGAQYVQNGKINPVDVGGAFATGATGSSGRLLWNVGVNAIGGATTTALNNILHGKKDSIVGAGITSGGLSIVGYSTAKLAESWISTSLRPTVSNSAGWADAGTWTGSGWNLLRPNSMAVIGGSVGGSAGQGAIGPILPSPTSEGNRK